MIDIQTKEVEGVTVAIVRGVDPAIDDVQAALDLMANVRYVADSDYMILEKSALSERFFELKTGLAGDIVQKWTNYQMKTAIVGDFSGYASRSLKDFIYECNQGSALFFADNEQQVFDRLAKTGR